MVALKAAHTAAFSAANRTSANGARSVANGLFPGLNGQRRLWAVALHRLKVRKHFLNNTLSIVEIITILAGYQTGRRRSPTSEAPSRRRIS